MRLIDADYLKEHLMACAINGRPLHRMYTELDDLFIAIDDVPTIDSKRKKGKWLLRTDERFDIDYYKCSECGYEPYRKMDISNFCPNCGCQMEVGEK
jgi:predicted Zn-ribbon and HTH transcriptional regulator